MQVIEFLTAVLGTLSALLALLQVDAARNGLARGVAYLVDQRRRVVVGVVSLVLTIGSLVAYSELRKRQGEKDDSQASTQILRGLLPPEFRGKCVASSDDDDEVVAALSCGIPSSKIMATYSLYSSERALAAKVKSRVTRLALPAARCEQAHSAHVVFRGSKNDVSGELLCYTTPDAERLEWTSTGLRVYATAERPAGDRARSAILDWWRKAGPSLSYARLDFPDADEDWLLRRIPVDSGAPANARRNWRPLRSIATVRCDAGPLITTVWYVRFLGNHSMANYFTERSKGARRIPWDKGRVCMDKTWNEYGLDGTEEDGRRFCWISQETSEAYIEWTDPRMSIYALASAPVSRRKGIAKWWWEESGPYPPAS